MTQEEKTFKYKEAISTSNEKIIIKKDKKENIGNIGNIEKLEKSKSKIKFFIILIILILAILALTIFLICYFLIIKKKKSSPAEEEKQKESDIPELIDDEDKDKDKDDDIHKYEKELKAFEPSFKISTKPDTLIQLSMKSSKIYSTTSYGKESSDSVYSKGKYDIYTLNETESEEKDFYTTKYTTVITINSLCTEFSSEKKDCELNRYLDLTKENKDSNNNLRRNDENNNNIKKVIIPICIIEHTDTNIILSVTCPNTLADNLKRDIILAFQNIKPSTFKGLIEGENIAGTTITEKDNKTYIKSFENICNDNNGVDSKNDCKTIKNIITDKDGNLISSERKQTDYIYINENINYSKNISYFFEDISQQNSYFDPINYKNNLNIVFDLVNSFMVKEKYFEEETFKEILFELAKNTSDNSNKLRQLYQQSDKDGLTEITIFNETIRSLEASLVLKNDLGLDETENAKAISNYNLDGINTLSYNCFNSKINETLNQFITLSKAGNNLANKLYNNLYLSSTNLRDIINNEINNLNDILSFQDLSSIFDATFSVEGLNKLPYSFVAAAQNLYNNIDEINNNIEYIVDDNKNIFKNYISSFIIQSHNLLSKIFQNLTETTSLFSSEKSKIAEISSYYLNNTDTSYVGIIETAKDILNNYYKNEKKLIEPLVNELINNFSENCINSINKEISTIEKVQQKLDKGEVSINLINNNDEIKQTITNLYNSKNKINDIISNVKEIFKRSLNLQNNGYFITQKDLELNNQSYGKISDQAVKIAQTLDNNLLIDEIFDNIMKNIRENISSLFDYMQKIKLENFTLDNNILNKEDSFFSLSSLNQFDNNLDKEKKKIIDFIKDENKEYLKEVNEIIKSINQNETNPEQLMINIKNELSEINIDNLNSKYNETFYNITNKIKDLIENNKKKAVEYLTNVKNSGTNYRTEGYVNKYNAYINNINQVRNYINLNLKNELTVRYKTIIDQLRSLLQNIKLNPIIKKYYNNLSYSENHLRIIDNLYSNINKYISDEIFNKNYIPKINIFINSSIENLNEIEATLKGLYNPISKLSYYSRYYYDCYKYVYEYYSCCRYSRRGTCYSYTTCYGHYVSLNVGGTNNHLSLEVINLEEYSEIFDKLYNEKYSIISNLTSSYINSLKEMDNKLEKYKEEELKNYPDYLYNISEILNKIINDNLGSNLLYSSYHYYRNELNEKLPIILNDILEKWKLLFDKINEEIDSNIDKFKSQVKEFYYISSNFYNIYYQNMTLDYVGSIVEQRKSDFNYTIKYYYNLVLSKINKTYSYILNNIPVNDKPFDDILKERNIEINQTYNNIINKIQEIKEQILKNTKQLVLLNASETNFFFINQIIVNNIENIKDQLMQKTKAIFDTCKKAKEEDSIESVISRFYLENSQNAKEIKDIYEPINKGTFIDLQNTVYQNLFDEIFGIDQFELIMKIKKSLKESKNNLAEYFKIEKEKYINQLKNIIYSKYYTVKDLIKKISSMYSNGLNSLDTNDTKLIYDYIDQILNRIESHIANETLRLSTELTSYNNNYTVIEDTLNSYKDFIYNQLYSNIMNVIKDFYSQFKTYFYENYIVSHLDEYYEQVKSYNFKEFKFLNSTINLKNIIDENIGEIINDYKNISKNKMDSLYKINIKKLEELISFSTIKEKINKEINNTYNTQLLPILQKYAIYNANDDKIKAYNFSLDISNDINSFINEKMQLVKEIINKMKGNEYNIKDIYFYTPDFTLIKINELQTMAHSFNNFTSTYSNIEKDEIYKSMTDIINNNFLIFINNFIPTFTNDFFNRIIKYNEIQKIKSLFKNLKYSITQTISYYTRLYLLHKAYGMPQDLKIKLLTLNNLDSIVDIKSSQLLSSLNNKLDNLFNNNKNYLIEKYISEIKKNENIKLEFDNKILLILEEILDGKRYLFEDKYISIINIYIKKPFIDQYTKILIQEKSEILDFVEKNIETIKILLNQITTMEPDETLSNIENKLNKTLNAIKDYNSHFDSFEIMPSVKQYLNEFGIKVILPKYETILNDLNFATRDIIITNLDLNSQNFEKAYSDNQFELKTKNITEYLTNYFKKMNTSLNDYGVIEEKYSENLKKEMIKKPKIRRLNNIDNNKNNENKKVADYKIDKTFKELKSSSLSNKEFIKNAFTSFDNKIEEYIRKINYQKDSSEITIKKIDGEDEAKQKLYDLYTLSIQYYNKANSTLYKLKTFITNSIYEIDNLIEKSANITYEKIASKYIEIKNNFIPVKELMNQENILLVIPNYTNTEINIETKIDNYSIINEFLLDVIFENDDIKKPKVIGKIINKIAPKLFQINHYTKASQYCRKSGERITPYFNNISFSSSLNFDVGSNEGIINNNIEVDEYYIVKEKYETKSVNIPIIINGIVFESEDECIEVEANKTSIRKDSIKNITNDTIIYD